jgi:hypothetical protein
MKKKLNKIIEIPCEENQKDVIASRVTDYLVNNEDYLNGNIVVKTDRFETVDVVIFEGCSNVEELTMVLTN